MRTASLAPGVLAALAVLACPVLSPAGDRAVARVGGEAVTSLQVEAAMAREPGLSRDQAIRVLSERLLVQQWAKKRGLAVTDQETDEAIASVRERNKMTSSQFEAALRQQGFTYASYREEMRASILLSRATATAMENRVAVSDREVEDRWRKEFPPRSTFTLRHLVLAAARDAPAADREAKKRKAEELLQQIRSGVLAFPDAVRGHSEDASTRDSGGDLGAFSPGELLPEMEKAAEALAEGQVGGPVEGPDGIHLIQLVSRKVVAPPSLDSVKEELAARLRQEKGESARRAWMSELEQEYLVETFPDGGAIPPAKDGGALPQAK
jgi:peptidyl-prolyl cis-trans isomerase SurA